MEKLYVNGIRSYGEPSAVGLFYSCAEAENIAAQRRSIPEQSDCRYKIVQANQQYLMIPDAPRQCSAPKE